MGEDKPCPCGSGRTFGRCCGPLLAGVEGAATAEALMRSRYSAYATTNIDYILKTWHPTTRPATISATAQWCGLTVLRCQGGGEGDDEGLVEFKARALLQGQLSTLREVSLFRREEGSWYYLSGDLQEEGEARGEKVGRNSPCPCGSGRKFKRCCGP